MKIIYRWSVAAVAVFSLAIAAECQDKDDMQGDIAKLQGVWQVTKFIDSSLSEGLPEERKDLTFEFRGTNVTQRKGKNNRGRPGTYKLDVRKKPKWIDIAFGEVSQGIYRLQGDELTLCVVSGMNCGEVAPRPMEFKASKNPPYSLLVLKKLPKRAPR